MKPFYIHIFWCVAALIYAVDFLIFFGIAYYSSMEFFQKSLNKEAQIVVPEVNNKKQPIRNRFLQ